MNASQKGCSEDQQNDGTLYTKHDPGDLSYDYTKYADEYKVILQGVVALKTLANNVQGEQTNKELGFGKLDDLVFRFDGSKPEVKEAFILETHFRKGYSKLTKSDLGSGYDDALSLDRNFEAFLESECTLLHLGQQLQHVVLFTNREISDDLLSLFAEIPKENLEFPLKQLLLMPSSNCQKFYSFIHPHMYDLNSFYSKPRIGRKYVQWWLDRNDGQLESLKLDFLKRLVIAVEQPDADQLQKIQAQTISGLDLSKTMSEEDRNLVVQLFNESVRNWMQAKDGEQVNAWTSKMTERCLREAIEKVMLGLQTGHDCSDVAKVEDLLINATLVGHVRAVEILLAKGGNVNATGREGRTLLHEATFRGYVDVVKALLDNGCKLDTRESRNHRTALHIAVSKGNLAIATLLLEHGSNPNLGIWSNQTPLHFAAKQGRLDLVNLLLEMGCDLNAQTDTGETALHFAVDKGHLDVAKLLLEHGCNVNARSSSGSALYYATRGGHLDMLNWLIEMGCKGDDAPSDETPLHVAASQGRLDVVQRLLETGCNVDVAVALYGTPLHGAVLYGHADIVKLLLEHGCDVNLSYKDMYSAMHSAAHRGDLSIVKMLESYGADLHSKARDGRTPIFEAARFGKVDVVEYLLQKNCDANAANEDGDTPLHIAVSGGHLEVVKLLIDCGCSLKSVINVKGRKERWYPPGDLMEDAGKTALHLAVCEGGIDLVKLLLDSGSDVNASDARGRSPLHHAARRGNLEMATLLLQRGGRGDARTETGETALHLATSDRKLDLATMLLDHGCDVNAAANDGRTALHCAAHFSGSGRLKCARMLIERGCNVNAVTAQGETALHIAAACGRCDQYSVDDRGVKDGGLETHVALATLLLDKGCDANAKTADGQTALDVAVAERSLVILQMLRDRWCAMTVTAEDVESVLRDTEEGTTFVRC